MPKTPSTGWNNQPFIERVAKEDMLVQCTCRLCRKSRTYLAKDLAKIFSPTAVVGELWGRCPACGRSEFWRERERYPSPDDVGHLVIRRLRGFRRKEIWGDEYYAPEAKHEKPPGLWGG
jgi:hypothetical protein